MKSLYALTAIAIVATLIVPADVDAGRFFFRRSAPSSACGSACACPGCPQAAPVAAKTLPAPPAPTVITPTAPVAAPACPNGQCPNPATLPAATHRRR